MSSRDDILREIFEQAERAIAEDRDAVAAELFTAYVRLRPDDAYAWFRLGESQRAIGLRDEAERSLLRSLELRPKIEWAVRARLGMLYMDCGEHEQAEAEFANAESDPDARESTWFWIIRGANLARATQLQAAERCHRMALTLQGGDLDEAWLNLGLVLRAQGRYADAADAFRQALQLTPEYEEARAGLRSLDAIEEAQELIARLNGVCDGDDREHGVE